MPHILWMEGNLTLSIRKGPHRLQTCVASLAGKQTPWINTARSSSLYPIDSKGLILNFWQLSPWWSLLFVTIAGFLYFGRLVDHGHSSCQRLPLLGESPSQGYCCPFRCRQDSITSPGSELTKISIAILDLFANWLLIDCFPGNADATLTTPP